MKQKKSSKQVHLPQLASFFQTAKNNHPSRKEDNESGERIIACPTKLSNYPVSRTTGFGTISIQIGQKIFVNDGQIAVLLKNSTIIQSIDAGLHSINSENMPLIFADSPPNRLLQNIHVFFVPARNSRYRWGTPQGILIERPGSTSVLLRAYGTFSLEVADMRKLIDYANSFPEYVFSEFNDFLLSRLVNSLHRVLIKYGIKKGKPLSELFANIEFLSQKMLIESRGTFLDIGLKLNDVKIHNIGLHDSSLAQTMGVEFEAFNQTSELRATIDQMGDEVRAMGHRIRTQEETLRKKQLESKKQEKVLTLYRFILGLLVLGVGCGTIFFIPSAINWTWFISHPHRLGIQVGMTIFLLGTCWIILDTDKKRRYLVLTSILFGIIVTIIQII
jgi:hypothetical protein